MVAKLRRDHRKARRETSNELTIIQARDDNGLDRGGLSGAGESGQNWEIF